jgi:hypothetical protein
MTESVRNSWLLVQDGIIYNKTTTARRFRERRRIRVGRMHH